MAAVAFAQPRRITLRISVEHDHRDLSADTISTKISGSHLT